MISIFIFDGIIKTANDIKESTIGKFQAQLDQISDSSPVANYLVKSGKQIILGNYTEDVTLLGTGVSIALDIMGLDFPCDVRDISTDIIN